MIIYGNPLTHLTLMTSGVLRVKQAAGATGSTVTPLMVTKITDPPPAVGGGSGASSSPKATTPVDVPKSTGIEGIIQTGTGKSPQELEQAAAMAKQQEEMTKQKQDLEKHQAAAAAASAQAADYKSKTEILKAQLSAASATGKSNAANSAAVLGKNRADLFNWTKTHVGEMEKNLASLKGNMTMPHNIKLASTQLAVIFGKSAVRLPWQKTEAEANKYVADNTKSLDDIQAEAAKPLDMKKVLAERAMSGSKLAPMSNWNLNNAEADRYAEHPNLTIAENNRAVQDANNPGPKNPWARGAVPSKLWKFVKNIPKNIHDSAASMTDHVMHLGQINEDTDIRDIGKHTAGGLWEGFNTFAPIKGGIKALMPNLGKSRLWTAAKRVLPWGLGGGGNSSLDFAKAKTELGKEQGAAVDQVFPQGGAPASNGGSDWSSLLPLLLGLGGGGGGDGRYADYLKTNGKGYQG